jgi:hypothetical protein
VSKKLFYSSEFGLLPYSDGSGFKITAMIEQDTEKSEPTISIESVWRVSASEWVSAARAIEAMLDRRASTLSGDERNG